MKIAWFSGGLSSALAAIMASSVDAVVRIWIDAELNDPLTDELQRFVEQRLGKSTILISSLYRDPVQVALTKKYLSSPQGAPCTRVLKQDVRLYFERYAPEPVSCHVFGFTAEEHKRAQRIRDLMPEYDFEFPLLERGLSKHDVLELARRVNAPIPTAYQYGFEHNNCIGCLKARSRAYWKKVKLYFPEQFRRVAEAERRLSYSLLRTSFLDELSDEGEDEVETEITGCSLWCLVAESELKDDGNTDNSFLRE